MRNKAQRRQQAISSIKSARRRGLIRFVKHQQTTEPGRYWVETRPSHLQERNHQTRHSEIRTTTARESPACDNSDDDLFDYRTTAGGVYRWESASVSEDSILVQCHKYDFEEVKHLLDGFVPIDYDLLRPIFGRFFRDSSAASTWWDNNVENFLAGSAAFTDDQCFVVFGQTTGAAERYSAWFNFIQQHPDFRGTAALKTNADGTVEVDATRSRPAGST